MNLKPEILSSTSDSCYHCGGDLTPDSFYQAELSGAPRFFCCAGCMAIAQTIHGQGLESFYARRIPLGSKPEDPTGLGGHVPDHLLAYDDPVLLDRFTRTTSHQNELETTLRLEKIRCAACVWLNEQHLRRLRGVKDVQINYVTQRATILFNPDIVKLSGLLHAVEQIGYGAWPFEPSESADQSKKERRQLLMRLGVAMLGMMQVMMYAWPTYTGAEDLLSEHALLLGWTSWALTVPVVFYSAGPMFIAAWHSIRLFPKTKMLGMDVPVTLAVGLAFVAGTINLVTNMGQSYFDSITMFVAFLLGARYVELLARQDAQGGAEALAKQLPATCQRLENYPESNAAKSVPVVRCVVGDILRISPGEIIPVDGILLSGESSLDESLLSGESRPIAKKIGDLLYAGSHNMASPIVMRVEAVGQRTRIAGIASLLDKALQAKPEVVGLAEKWAGYFVVFLMTVSLFTALTWFYLDASRAWEVAVAVLVASCPCALSLATPAAMAAAQGAVTKLGLLVVRGHVMETLAKATDLVLDKTGTLTTGKPQLQQILQVRSDYTPEGALAIALAMELGQKHPLAFAIQQAAENQQVAPAILSDECVSELGKGLRAGALRLGSRAWVGLDASTLTRDLEKYQQSSLVYLSDEKGLIALFALLDTPRDGAQELIDAAKKRGMKVHLVSGDDPQTVAWWAGYFGIDDYVGGALPEDKLRFSEKLQAEGQTVWAVGDGVNDAPFLAKANISVAVGSGAPLAQAGADAVLTAESLKPLTQALALADKTRIIMQQNLAWAFVYNVVAIPIAMMGWVNPWIAGIGMSLSSLAVTLNAWRLRKPVN
jgi:P-type Cu2+ transporter